MSGAGRAGGVEGREGNDIDLAGPAVEEEGPGWENEPAEESPGGECSPSHTQMLSHLLRALEFTLVSAKPTLPL